MVQKVMVVVGTRPEAIKLAPVIKALKADARYECVVCATGQHEEMLYGLLDWFSIDADYRLHVMEPGQPLSFLTGKLLKGLHEVIEKELPDILMVQGDTTTAFIGALAGYYGYDHYIRENMGKGKHVKVAHVEAGLRTYDNYAPYPEEGNRKMIGQLAHWHFAPTFTAAEALYDENITKNVFITGNTVIDALYDTVEIIKKNGHNQAVELDEDKKLILVTGHRRENYGEGFENIAVALSTIAKQHPEAEIVYPVHMNQKVRDVINTRLEGIENIKLIEPLDYPQFVQLMMKAHLVLTDSGGVQEEAPSLGKPVLVMREVTERTEGLIAGTVKLVGTDPARIAEETSKLLSCDVTYMNMAGKMNPYGDGLATVRILNILAGEDVSQNTYNFVAA